MPQNHTNMEIERDILQKLKEWKDSRRRKPLILNGARQVGKSWILKKFGETCFDDFVYFNFDIMPSLKADFARTKEPQRLIRTLSMTAGKNILPETTLIIFDEIQECNDALNSLKYFCEDMPEYAIVCAGSLLGVALNRNGASFPVGKVDFMRMFPVSFGEFLHTAENNLYDIYMLLDSTGNVPESIHQRLSDAYKTYLALGGMPEVISEYIDCNDWNSVTEIQENILTSYSLDFSKHISNKDIPRVFQVWGNMQDQLAREDRRFKYADIQKGARAREYETAIEWLCLAGLARRVNAIETPRLPLSAYKKAQFKLYLNDVGLLCRKFNLSPSSAIKGNVLLTEFKGVLSENYALQALDRQFGNNIYYWTSGNTAEVEFLLQHENDIIPIEVKSEKNVKAKSLSLYRKTYSPGLSIRLSMLNMQKDGDLLNIPLYLADRIRHFISR